MKKYLIKVEEKREFMDIIRTKQNWIEHTHSNSTHSKRQRSTGREGWRERMEEA